MIIIIIKIIIITIIIKIIMIMIIIIIRIIIIIKIIIIIIIIIIIVILIVILRLLTSEDAINYINNIFFYFPIKQLDTENDTSTKKFKRYLIAENLKLLVNSEMKSKQSKDRILRAMN